MGNVWGQREEIKIEKVENFLKKFSQKEEKEKGVVRWGLAGVKSLFNFVVKERLVGV